VSTLKETPGTPTTRRPPSGPIRRLAPVRPHVAGAIFARNFLGYFSSPAGYVFITLFVLVASWAEFWQPVFFADNLANLDPLDAWMPYILLVFVPAITMNIWAEERKQGTDELLLTLPARDAEVVLGKYAAAVGIYTVALAFLAVGHVPLLMSLGRPDLGVLAATYLGDWLMGAMLIAVGMVASVLSTNVTVAFILGALFCAVPVFAGWLGPALQMVGALGRVPGLGWTARWFEPLAAGGAARWAEALSVPGQFRDFGAGVVPLPGVLYFVALAWAMLYLNNVLLGRRHWAGGRASAGRWLHATIRVVALVVALVSLDVVVLRWLNVRVDATEGGLHTLSAISRQILREIPADRPVYIQAYVSPEVPREYVEVRTNLVNTLNELAALGGDRVRLNLVEADRFSPEAREAESRFGIKPREVITEVDGRQRPDDLTLGVAITSGLEQVVVPFFDRGLPIEYELIRSIRVVTGSERKRVGILDTDAHLLGGMDFQSFARDPEWDVVSELKKQYEVTPVSADLPIPFEEVQTISALGTPRGGHFTLTFDDQTTGEIPFDADAAKVAEALGALKAVGPGHLKVEGGPLPKEPITVTFAGAFTGRDVPELVASSKLDGDENPEVKVATTTKVLDALVVAQASSLTQPQMDVLAEFIDKGGPTLLLIDPAPLVNLALSPLEERMPGMRGMGPTQPEPKGDLGPLLESLNLEWPVDRIVWADYNPHRSYEFPPEYVFIGPSNGAKAPFGKDRISSGLQEVFLAFPGLLRNRDMPGKPEVTPLLQTGPDGGTLTFDEAIERGPLGMSDLRPARPHFGSGDAYTLAAHVRGKEPESGGRPIHVVAIADLDLISDSMFALRRRPVESLDEFDFDNVTFLLNAVDVLAGDDRFLDLRKRRPRHRTLTTLEAETRAFVERARAEQKKAEEDADARLAKAQEALDKAVAEISNSKEYDARTKESMVLYRESVERQRLKAATAEIEAEKRQAIERSKQEQEAAVAAIENRVRAQAITLTPLPPLVLACVVFFLRASRENLGANPERLRA
jgi:ABC-type transport system involved in multi-copper enzyme maturation permease subunit/ABC-type uncharacterized transport system involved in gliding motility auxiliary subunit